MQNKKVLLIIPDLIDPVPYLKQIPSSELPDLSIFSKILSRGKWIETEHTELSVAANDYYTLLFKELDYPQSFDKTRLPLASLSYLAEAITDLTKNHIEKEQWIMRADPCFMKPDRDQLLLADTKIDISLNEAKQLVNEINQFFYSITEEQFWHLECTTENRWYIISDKPIQLDTIEPEKVLMQSIKSFLPKGSDSSHWVNLFNEFQMILHQSTVNKQRLEQGKVPINSVWFWGAGKSINRINNSHNEPLNHQVYSNNIIVEGLSQLNQIAYTQLPENYQSEQTYQKVTYIFDELSQTLQSRDIFALLTALELFEDRYLTPILKELQSGRLIEVQFVSPTGKKLLITKKLLNRWWRKIKPYQLFLA